MSKHNKGGFFSKDMTKGCHVKMSMIIVRQSLMYKKNNNTLFTLF